jgi:thiol:disulfide interchange protein DsbA
MKLFVPMVATFALVSGIFGAASAARAATPPPTPAAAAAPKWVEGRNYFPIVPVRPTGLPAGKVQVTEVFSYACPACNQFQPYMRKLERSVPANAVINFIPASFNPAEAVWTTGELATTDPSTGGLKAHMPTIEDAARFYEKHTGVPAAKFVATSKSFGVDSQVRIDEEAIKQFGVDRTPTIVVNGKYRLQVDAAGGADSLIELVNWLVAKESK